MNRKILDFFTSIRLTIVLLILLSAVCVIGTVVPQNAAEHEYLHLYSQGTYQLLKATGCTDLYHCWWFVAVLALFSLNLAACTFTRLGRLRRMLKPADPAPAIEHLQAMPSSKRISFKKAPQEDALVSQVRRFMGTAPVITRSGQETWISAETGRLSYLGFYLTHIGMITIIAGVLVGTAGYQGFMKINEGETQGSITLKNSLEQRDLGFSIRCDRFEVSYYDKDPVPVGEKSVRERGMPKDYKSWLVVIDKGREVEKKVIEVNDPLIYNGIYFYQSSYGTTVGGDVLVRIKPAGAGPGREYRAAKGIRFAIEGTQDEAMVETVLPDFAMDNGRFFSRSDEPNNPAARVVIYRGGKELESAWAFMNFPDFHRRADAAYVVELASVSPRYYTGLQVTRDPGVNIVWLGCVLMIGGLCLSFFMAHRRLWLVLQQDGGAARAVLAGSSNKNRQAFTAEFNRFFESMKSMEKQS